MPGRRFKPFGILVELSRIPLGIALANVTVATAVCECMSELHGDLVAHYNYLRGQDSFRESVTIDLESL